MRILAVAFAASFSVAVSLPALAAGEPADTPAASDRQTGPDAPAPETLTRAEQLDKLFDQLKAMPDSDAAQAVEGSIEAIWLQSGSPTVDLLMIWTVKAMERKEYPLALDYLDRITTMKPDYAEGWNKRATVYFLTEEYARSLADLERVLALEPRHFVALAGLGTILRTLGDDRRALVAYREALALDPHLDEVAKAAEQLAAKGADGVDL